MTTAAQNAVAQAAALSLIAPNETITLSGDVSGSGTTSITATLATVNSNVGTFQGVTLNGKGLATAAAANATLQTTQIATSVGLTTSSATSVQMGLGTTAVSGSGNATVITPETSGKIMVTICFSAQNATGTDFGSASINYGTGSPPAAGHAGLGNLIGPSATWGQTNAAGNTPYFQVTLNALITGAAKGTALWFDVVWLNGTGARAITAYDISATAYEV